MNILSGVFLYTEATSLPPGSIYQLVTPRLESIKPAPYLVTFYYHMMGVDMGALRVYEVYADNSISPSLWEDPGGYYDG